MKTKLFLSAIALSIVGWCYAANYYTFTLYSDGCESANVIKCNSGQQINVSAIPENEHRHFVRWTDGNTDNPRLVTVTKDMTFTAEFALITSGQCGDNLYWKYVNHTLTIFGAGNMYDYNENDMPWLLFRDTTDMVVLERGITGIGNNAFNGFVKLGKIELPSTLSSIGANAFAGCRKLYDIYSYAVEPPVADNTSFANSTYLCTCRATICVIIRWMQYSGRSSISNVSARRIPPPMEQLR